MTDYQSFVFEEEPHYQIFKIQIPELSGSRLIKLDVNQRVEALATNLATKWKLQPPEDYGFECQNVFLENSKLLSFYQLPNETLLTLTKRVHKYKVKIILNSKTHEEKNITISIPLFSSVADLHHALKKHPEFPRNIPDLSKFSLFWKSDNSSTKMEDKRRIATYKIKPTDIIEFRGKIKTEKKRGHLPTSPPFV